MGGGWLCGLRLPRPRGKSVRERSHVDDRSFVEEVAKPTTSKPPEALSAESLITVFDSIQDPVTLVEWGVTGRKVLLQNEASRRTWGHLSGSGSSDASPLCVLFENDPAALEDALGALARNGRWRGLLSVAAAALPTLQHQPVPQHLSSQPTGLPLPSTSSAAAEGPEGSHDADPFVAPATLPFQLPDSDQRNTPQRQEDPCVHDQSHGSLVGSPPPVMSATGEDSSVQGSRSRPAAQCRLGADCDGARLLCPQSNVGGRPSSSPSAASSRPCRKDGSGPTRSGPERMRRASPASGAESRPLAPDGSISAVLPLPAAAEDGFLRTQAQPPGLKPSSARACGSLSSASARRSSTIGVAGHPDFVGRCYSATPGAVPWVTGRQTGSGGAAGAGGSAPPVTGRARRMLSRGRNLSFLSPLSDSSPGVRSGGAMAEAAAAAAAGDTEPVEPAAAQRQALLEGLMTSAWGPALLRSKQQRQNPSVQSNSHQDVGAQPLRMGQSQSGSHWRRVRRNQSAAALLEPLPPMPPAPTTAGELLQHAVTAATSTRAGGLPTKAPLSGSLRREAWMGQGEAAGSSGRLAQGASALPRLPSGLQLSAMTSGATTVSKDSHRGPSWEQVTSGVHDVAAAAWVSAAVLQPAARTSLDHSSSAFSGLPHNSAAVRATYSAVQKPARPSLYTSPIDSAAAVSASTVLRSTSQHLGSSGAQSSCQTPDASLAGGFTCGTSRSGAGAGAGALTRILNITLNSVSKSAALTPPAAGSPASGNSRAPPRPAQIHGTALGGLSGSAEDGPLLDPGMIVVGFRSPGRSQECRSASRRGQGCSRHGRDDTDSASGLASAVYSSMRALDPTGATTAACSSSSAMGAERGARVLGRMCSRARVESLCDTQEELCSSAVGSLRTGSCVLDRQRPRVASALAFHPRAEEQAEAGPQAQVQVAVDRQAPAKADVPKAAPADVVMSSLELRPHDSLQKADAWATHTAEMAWRVPPAAAPQATPGYTAQSVATRPSRESVRAAFKALSAPAGRGERAAVLSEEDESFGYRPPGSAIDTGVLPLTPVSATEEGVVKSMFVAKDQRERSASRSARAEAAHDTLLRTYSTSGARRGDEELLNSLSLAAEDARQRTAFASHITTMSSCGPHAGHRGSNADPAAAHDSAAPAPATATSAADAHAATGTLLAEQGDSAAPNADRDADMRSESGRERDVPGVEEADEAVSNAEGADVGGAGGHVDAFVPCLGFADGARYPAGPGQSPWRTVSTAGRTTAEQLRTVDAAQLHILPVTRAAAPAVPERQRPQQEAPVEAAASPPLPPPQRWYEVSLTGFLHPQLGRPVILILQNDVSSRIWAESQLARVVEAEHTLLENIFPHHVIEYMATTTAAAAAAAAAATSAAAPAPQDQLAKLLGAARYSRTGPAAASSGANAVGPNSAGSSVQQQQQQQQRAAGEHPQHGPSHDSHVPVIRGDTFLPLATSHSAITVMFCDIQGFTPMCNMVSPGVVMAFLNDLFTRLDALLDVYGVYKVETIGDCYVAAGGLMRVDEETGAVTVRSDDVDPRHADSTVQFAKALLCAASAVRLPTSGQPVRLRVGIHSGPAMSGVVGTRMPRFCLFGDTMNTASRMESSGVPGSIHVSAATRELVPGEDWAATGGVQVKGKGLMETYLLTPPMP